jgi:predicted nucleic acid-binding protein
LIELGFLRISTHKKAFNVPMDKARELLAKSVAERNVARIADDLPALDSEPERSEEVTDRHLADLAANHGFKSATLDTGIAHHAVELVR